MTLIEKLDAFLTDMLGKGLNEGEIAELLLFEDFQLAETVKRVRRKVSGINVTVRKVGRPNPLRSQKAKRAARAHRATRAAANRRFQRSPKAKQMRRVMSRVRKTKPKRLSRPKRPTMRRPKRPAMRRPPKRHGPPRRKRYGPPRRRRR